MANSIDIVLSDYLEAVDDYFRLKDSLAGQMKQGFLDISKSRYIMGVTSVSHYKYSNDMAATATVNINDRSSTDGLQEFSINRCSARTAATGELSVTRSEPAHDDQSGLRRRRGKEEEGTAVEGRNESLGELEGSVANVRSSPPVQDPLHWFGVLVPPSLRSAQRNFIDALNLSAQITTQQSKCDRLRCQYLSMRSDGACGPADIAS